MFFNVIFISEISPGVTLQQPPKRGCNVKNIKSDTTKENNLKVERHLSNLLQVVSKLGGNVVTSGQAHLLPTYKKNTK